MRVMPCTQAAAKVPGQPRELDPTRDLGEVADLIANAFAQEMDDRGRAALREMRWMARLSPLVWWLSQVDPSFRDAFSGFVWRLSSPSGRGRIVGNVNLNRALGRRHWYIICNVVVREDYRQQGIGRCLTEQALAQAEELAAEGVMLQVRKDNVPAMRLYTDLGFVESSGEVDLRLSATSSVAILNPAGCRIRAWRPRDGEAVYDLARWATPEVPQWLRPLRRETFAPDWGHRLLAWLGGFLAGRRTYRLLAVEGDRLTGLLQVDASFRGGEHRLSLLVDPDHAGQVEGALVSRGLHMLAALPPQPVHTTLFVEQEAALEVLRGYGFQEGRTLLTLKRVL
jgi:ribosomal protein S18 acetylase RimI-like enzyme